MRRKQNNRVPPFHLLDADWTERPGFSFRLFCCRLLLVGDVR